MFYLMNYHDNYSVITKEIYYEIVIIMFKSKIQGLSSSHDASANYQREKKALRMKITDLENELINLNTSSVEELQLIKGIGPKLANRIVAYRDQNGDFEVVEDILLVSGVGEAKFSKIKELLEV